MIKNSKPTKTILLIICTIAMSIAAASSSMCFVWLFYEPKMPKSLIKS